MFNKILVTILFVILSTTIYSCRPTYINQIDLAYFYKYSKQYLQEIPMESRQLENPEMGEIKIKIYIEEINSQSFTIQGKLQTISDINKPSDFDKICLDEECYDLFIFIKGKKTKKDISIFYDEFQKFSIWYPHISNHLPVWEINISKREPTIKKIY